MKRIVLFMLMLVTLGVGYAQRPEARGKMWREVQEFKLKYLAQEIDLKEEDRAKFNDLYSRLEKERGEIFCEARKARKCVKGDKNATQADYEAASQTMANCRAKEAALVKEYDKKFAAFLSPKQIFKLHEAEDVFNNKMREMRKNHKR